MEQRNETLVKFSRVAALPLLVVVAALGEEGRRKTLAGNQRREPRFPADDHRPGVPEHGPAGSGRRDLCWTRTAAGKRMDGVLRRAHLAERRQIPLQIHHRCACDAGHGAVSGLSAEARREVTAPPRAEAAVSGTAGRPWRKSVLNESTTARKRPARAANYAAGCSLLFCSFSRT
jgi:hypothetical protein